MNLHSGYGFGRSWQESFEVETHSGKFITKNIAETLDINFEINEIDQNGLI